MILVTGGAGFIGANFVLQWIEDAQTPVVNLDKLTYAGNLNNLASLEHETRHHFIQGDILNKSLLEEVLAKYKPQAIVHFAAETHVDRSIYHPHDFFQTNVMGTQVLLDSALAYWKHLGRSEQNSFRFLHVSTDEVYGSIGPNEAPTKESSPYAPNSPYAASKAASDYAVRSYFHTYGLPVLTTHSSNNFGPYQFPEKLLPLMIVKALQRKPLPLYGDGLNIRSWIYVSDHCEALRLILAKGKPGETYNIADQEEHTNKEIVLDLCSILDEFKGSSSEAPFASLIKYVKDRPGHDRRYSIDASKLHKEIGWKPRKSFKENLRYTVQWYLENLQWVENVISGEYRDWITTNYYDRETIP